MLRAPINFERLEERLKAIDAELTKSRLLMGKYKSAIEDQEGHNARVANALYWEMRLTVDELERQKARLESQIRLARGYQDEK